MDWFGGSHTQMASPTPCESEPSVPLCSCLSGDVSFDFPRIVFTCAGLHAGMLLWACVKFRLALDLQGLELAVAFLREPPAPHIFHALSIPSVTFVKGYRGRWLEEELLCSAPHLFRQDYRNESCGSTVGFFFFFLFY